MHKAPFTKRGQTCTTADGTVIYTFYDEATGYYIVSYVRIGGYRAALAWLTRDSAMDCFTRHVTAGGGVKHA